MSKTIFRRFLLSLLTIILICTLTFFVMHIIPGGPFQQKKLSDVTREALNERYHLNEPLITQYFLYLKGLLKGDLGVSITDGRSINEIIRLSFPISCKLGLAAVSLALIAGTVFGTLAAYQKGKFLDKLILFLSTFTTAIPSFVLSILLLFVFCVKLKWFPIWSIHSPSYVLPVLALSMYPMAYTTRLARTSMLEALGQDYIRTAKAKGLSSGKVLFRHALRNSLIPIITFAGPEIAYIVTGSMVVESIFNIAGIGSSFVTAITARDYTMIMATTLLLAILMVIMNLICDILYQVIDPRIRYD